MNENMIFALGLFFFILFLLAIIVEIAHVAVLGWFLSDAEIEKIIGKRLNGFCLIRFDILGNECGHCVSIYWSPLSKWSINDIGSIPRWSKWSKKLDEKRLSLLAQVK